MNAPVPEVSAGLQNRPSLPAFPQGQSSPWRSAVVLTRLGVRRLFAAFTVEANSYQPILLAILNTLSS